MTSLFSTDLLAKEHKEVVTEIHELKGNLILHTLPCDVREYEVREYT